MRFAAVTVALASALVVSAADIQVLVGDGGALAFTPPNVTVASGDTIHFEFRAKNHSVTQSTFADPCQIMTTPKMGIDSGFQAVAAGATSFPSWSFTVDNATAPLWFFCAQTVPANHCQSGMVFAVNASPDKTFTQFQANAKASASNSTATPSGGAPASGGASGTPPAPTASASGFSTVVGSPAGAATSTGTAPATTGTTTTNGALRSGGSAAGILAVIGLVAGLVL